MASIGTSRAWIATGPNKIGMEHLELPQVADDMALLMVEACGICGTDKHLLSGLGPDYFPVIPGHGDGLAL